MIAEIFDSGLQDNNNYSITISVEDEHFEGNVSTTANFSKLLIHSKEIFYQTDCEYLLLSSCNND